MPPSTGQQAQLENGSHSPVASTSQARVKHSRPHSPVLAAADPSQAHDFKPPAPKRARKAINCEPCRNSKLKCDRYMEFSPSLNHKPTLTSSSPITYFKKSTVLLLRAAGYVIATLRTQRRSSHLQLVQQERRPHAIRTKAMAQAE